VYDEGQDAVSSQWSVVSLKVSNFTLELATRSLGREPCLLVNCQSHRGFSPVVSSTLISLTVLTVFLRG